MELFSESFTNVASKLFELLWYMRLIPLIFQEMPSSKFIPFFFFNGSQNWVHLPIFFTPCAAQSVTPPPMDTTQWILRKPEILTNIFFPEITCILGSSLWQAMLRFASGTSIGHRCTRSLRSSVQTQTDTLVHTPRIGCSCWKYHEQYL